MDHNEERRKDDGIWNGYKKYIIDFLRLDCNLRDDFKEEEIERASGIFWTNAFSCSNGGGQAVFPTFSFVSHSCTSNCDHTVFPQRHLVLQSKVHIAAGTELNINYISPIQGRLKRRSKLRCKWFFDCICDRCLDATELGSHLSSHLCEFCGEILLPSDPLIMDSNYVCPSGHSKSSEEILSFEHKVTLEMKENITKNDLESFYKLLNKYSANLHATHYLMILLKRHIITIYGESTEQEDLEKKIDLCEEVLNGICKMDSGYNRDRGMVLQYLCDAQKKLNRLLMSLGRISEEEFKSRVEVCMKNFNEANECLLMKIKKN
uniref:SET domain-containing protein n=1 Tax=Lepeophtheirus salmonis TaxID=72036 RepID=A0A0K2U0Z5_LEPSM